MREREPVEPGRRRVDAQRDPFERGAGDRVGDAARRDVRLHQRVLAVERDGLGELSEIGAGEIGAGGHGLRRRDRRQRAERIAGRRQRAERLTVDLGRQRRERDRRRRRLRAQREVSARECGRGERDDGAEAQPLRKKRGCGHFHHRFDASDALFKNG